MITQRDFSLELKTYHDHEKQLQQHLYKWVVIVGTEIVGIHNTFEEAIMTEGGKHGLDKIFVHEITPVGHRKMVMPLLAAA